MECKFTELLDVSRKELDVRLLVEDYEPKPTEEHRKEAVEVIRKVLEKDLFIYDRLDMKLPSTVFQADNKKLVIAALSVPHVSADQEVKQLAFSSDFSAEMPMLRVTRLTTSYSPYLKLHIEGAKNAAWTMRDCHAFVEGEGFWDVLKQSYGSFQVSAAKSTFYPVALQDNLLNIADFNASSAVDTPVNATISTNAHVKGALNKLKAGGDPEFEIQLRFRAQESNQRLLLCSFSVRASQLLEAGVNLASSKMGERPTAALQPAQEEKQRRKLSPIQLEQLWNQGQFEVPSKLFPGSSHVWELSRLLLAGANIRTAALRRTLSFSFEQLREMRLRLYNSEHFLDIVSCAKSVKNGLWDVVATLVGVPMRQHLYSSSGVRNMLLQQRVWYLLETLKLRAPSLQAASGSALDDWVSVESSKEIVRVKRAMELGELPMFLESSEDKEICVEMGVLKYPMAKDRLGVIIENVTRQWRRDRLAFATQEELRIRALSAAATTTTTSTAVTSSTATTSATSTSTATATTSTATSTTSSTAAVSAAGPAPVAISSATATTAASEEKLLAALQDSLDEEFNRRCLRAIETDTVLRAIHPRLPSALAQRINAALIVRVERAEWLNRTSKLQSDFESSLEQSHPISFLLYSWRNKQVANYMQRFDKRGWMHPALERLDHTSAAILRTNSQFDTELAPDFTKRFESYLQPSQRIRWTSTIWNPKNWKLERKNGSWRAKKHVEYFIPSDQFGWRLKSFARGTACTFNNFNFVMLACFLLNGPLSLRALFSPNAFTPGWRVNEETGVLEKDPRSTQQTLWSRISALWKQARVSRDAFEAQADTGLLGKSITRWFSRIWSWGFVAGLGSLLVGTVLPPLCVLNTAFCVGCIVLSPALVSAWMVIRYLFSVVIYDPFTISGGRVHSTWGSSYRPPGLPLPSALFRVLLGAVAKPTVLLGSLLVIHPLLAAVSALFASLRWLFYYLWDLTAFTLLIRPLARVPCENGFLQRRVAGPGLSWSWFHQVTVGEALVALRGYLEKLQLEFYESYVTEVVDAPIQRAETVIREMFGPFSVSVSPAVALKGVVGRAHETRQRQLQHLLADRRGLFPSISEPQRMRMTEEDLRETTMRGARLVEQFMREGVFPSMSSEHIAQWWSDQKLQPDSWTELTLEFLRRSICTGFTEPIHESEKMFRFATEQVGMTEFLEMVEQANPRDHLDKVTAVVGRASRDRESYHTVRADLLSEEGDFYLSSFPLRTSLERSHRVFLRALRGEVPKDKEEDEAEGKQLAAQLDSVYTCNA